MAGDHTRSPAEYQQDNAYESVFSRIYPKTDGRRHARDPHKKDTIKYLILGFMCAGVLSLTNTPRYLRV